MQQVPLQLEASISPTHQAIHFDEVGANWTVTLFLALCMTQNYHGNSSISSNLSLEVLFRMMVEFITRNTSKRYQHLSLLLVALQNIQALPHFKRTYCLYVTILSYIMVVKKVLTVLSISI
jgi:hypothetical protein